MLVANFWVIFIPFPVFPVHLVFAFGTLELNEVRNSNPGLKFIKYFCMSLTETIFLHFKSSNIFTHIEVSSEIFFWIL